jgi:hypothetical protein
MPTVQPAVCIRPALNVLVTLQIMAAAWRDNQELYVTARHS